MDIIFNSKEHKKFFFEYLDKCKVNDEYHRAFFYVIGLSDEARQNINRLFDFKEDCIKLEGLHDGWQTSGSIKACLLAFKIHYS